MPVAQFVALIDELISEDVGSVALGGGEPTLHPALPVLLDAARKRGLRAGLTTNARDPGQIMAPANSGLLYSFGVSVGKGEWTILAAHPRAVINLLLLRKGLKQVTRVGPCKLFCIRPFVCCFWAIKVQRHRIRPENGRTIGRFQPSLPDWDKDQE